VRAYLDSVLVIYLIEQNPAFAPAVESWLLGHPCDVVSSELVRLECLVVPTRNGDAARVADFESFFQTRVAEMVPLGRAVFDRAIGIRANHRFKTPDALNLAAAVEAGCDVYVTNDLQLRRFTDIAVEVI
jgi:predicted nucleic acid-binding protein